LPEGPGGGWKVRCPEGPGGAGSSGGQDFAKNKKLQIGKLGGKTSGKRKFWDAWRGGEARSTCYTRNPWIKSNKISSNSQIIKKFGRAIFVGIFEIATKQSKIRLEN
jgi:hypothetical protein